MGNEFTLIEAFDLIRKYDENHIESNSRSCFKSTKSLVPNCTFSCLASCIICVYDLIGTITSKVTMQFNIPENELLITCDISNSESVNGHVHFHPNKSYQQLTSLFEPWPSTEWIKRAIDQFYTIINNLRDWEFEYDFKVDDMKILYDAFKMIDSRLALSLYRENIISESEYTRYMEIRDKILNGCCWPNENHYIE